MPSICPKCGQPLSAYAPQGLCPCCLLLGGLASTADAVASSEFEVSSSGTIRYFGDYELLEEIARGGMGVVYRARQLSLNRLVALKMIAAGRLATPQAVERFRTETEAVALLDHPNVVPIYQVGAEAGMHYYAMKLVEGGSLAQRMRNDECRMRNGSSGRKEAPFDIRHSSFLIAKVARAVHYAHQRGILHRDLKPGNILIDGAGEPYVTDFGLAKFVVPPLGGTDQPAKAGTTNPLTQSLAIIGTPSYMAPEQAAGQSKRLTTAADIYSLGAILYELLAGRPPFTGENELEILRRVVEEEPLPPSVVSRSRPVLRSSTAEGGREKAHSAKSQIGNRKSEIDKDLETICLKCLHKEPAQRYGSAEALAQDLDRWRAGETIEARPSTVMEKTWRWCRRKPALTGALAAVLLLLVTVAVVSTTMALRLKLAKDRAQSAEVDAKEKARQATEAEAEAREVLEFFKDKVLAAARPMGQAGGLGREATIRAAVDAVEPTIARAFTNQPLVEATIRDTLGTTYQYLGDYGSAIRQYLRAGALRKDKLGSDHRETLITMNNLALAYQQSGQGSDALRLLEETVRLSEAKFGRTDLLTLRPLNNLARTYLSADQVADAIPLFEEVLKSYRIRLGPTNASTLTVMHNLASAYDHAGRSAEALPILKETLKYTKAKFGPDHPDTLISMNALAEAYRHTGRLDDALSLFEELVPRGKKQLGPDHPDTLTWLGNLASTYHDKGRLPDALPLYEETLRLSEDKLGHKHPATINSMNDLATAYHDAGDFAKALPLMEETLKLTTERHGPAHADTLRKMKNLAVGYFEANRMSNALPLFQEVLTRREAQAGPTHAETLKSMQDPAKACMAAKQFTNAEPLLRKLVERTRQTRGQDDRVNGDALTLLGQCLLRQDKHAEAEPLLREALPILEKHQPELSPTFTAQSLLGWALLDQKKYAEAERLLVQAYEGLERREAERPSRSRAQALKEIGERIVHLYEALAQPDQAATWRAKLAKLPRSAPKLKEQ